MRRAGVFLATVGGAGFFPIAPGTVGSAIGVAIYLAIREWPGIWQLALVAAISVVGTWASSEATHHFRKEDPGHVIVDEVAGQLVTLLFTGAGLTGALAGFIIFRVLDIVKPWPARQFEALPAGVGIMADDLMAGAYGWLLMSAGMFILSGS